MSSFDPALFISIAKRIADNDLSLEARRTIVGRCYYAAYGSLRVCMAAANGTTEKRLFGDSGRHRDLHTALSYAGREFGVLANSLGSLLSKRVRADYEYDGRADITEREAWVAIDEAEEALSEIERIEPRSFSKVAFLPK